MRRGEVEKGTKTALVTGASMGIGLCYAEQLAALGYNLVLVSRSEEQLQQVSERISQQYDAKVAIHVQDLAKIDAAEELFDWCNESGIKVDVLINNAGFGDCNRFLESDLEKELDMIDVNVKAMHILMKLFLKKMEENKEEGWRDYLEICKIGGTKSFLHPKNKQQ